MSAETMKIPDPIIDPTTSEIAASGPIPRMNSDGGLLSTGATRVGVAMRRSRVGGGGGRRVRGPAGRTGRARGRYGVSGAIAARLCRAHRLVHDRLPRRGEAAHDLGR